MNQSLKVEKTRRINKSAEELYHFWHNFENLPRFMKHLKDVQVQNDKRSHWTTSGPLGTSVEWDADIVEERENELIAWASVAGADVDNSGSVRFQPAPGNRGTEVKVVTEYNPPGGAIGATIAKLFGEAPEQQIGDDLRPSGSPVPWARETRLQDWTHRFKMLMEAGEIATTEGQPKGG